MDDLLHLFHDMPVTFSERLCSWIEDRINRLSLAQALPNGNHDAELAARFRKFLRTKGYSRKTIKVYVRHLIAFKAFIGKSVADTEKDDVTSFTLKLLEQGCSHSYTNQMLSALKLFFTHVYPVSMGWDLARPRRERKLPDVLSVEEVRAILNAVTNIKHKTLLYITYSSGLRVGEVVRIRTEDIDRERNVIKIRQGKGRKDRYTLLSQRAL